MRCFCYKKEGHVKVNCPMWKKVMEKDEKIPNQKWELMLLLLSGTS
jgi:hypothetical protein